LLAALCTALVIGIPPRAGIGSGILGWFAVGCPLCNKLVVGLIGASGATSVFEPLQPALGVMAVGLAAAALYARVRVIRRGSCPVPGRGERACGDRS
jgi:hypothetical protein